MTTASAALPSQDRDTTAILLKAALICLVAHSILSAFSAFAFATFLSPPLPAWLATPTNAKAYAIGYQWGGQTTVVLGALAGILHAMGRLGSRTALTIFGVSFTVSLGSELLGTYTGLPFGVYGYTNLLGYKILDLVPFNIPTSWFFMLYASLAICARLLPAKDDATSRWWWALMAGVVLTAWDVSMDPAMVKTRHWIWSIPDLSGESAFAQFIGREMFYGMPLTNWLGWLLTGIIVARLMLMIVPPTRWARDVAPSRFPLVLYGVNGLLPIAICLRQDMPWAGVLGFIAMAIPLGLAWRAGAPAVAPAPARGGSLDMRSVAVAGD
jgi:putative membrane protein